jgi:hypothetical protein
MKIFDKSGILACDEKFKKLKQQRYFKLKPNYYATDSQIRFLPERLKEQSKGPRPLYA